MKGGICASAVLSRLQLGPPGYLVAGAGPCPALPSIDLVLFPRNCLFRAFADQLPYRHDNLRHTVVQHMRANEEDYAPFVEDDITFEAYSE